MFVLPAFGLSTLLNAQIQMLMAPCGHIENTQKDTHTKIIVVYEKGISALKQNHNAIEKARKPPIQEESH